MQKMEVDNDSKQFMDAVNRAIFEFTHHTPMSVEQIVMCLGYIAGRGIGHIEERKDRRTIKSAVEENIGAGIDQQLKLDGKTVLLMPASVVQ